MRTVLQKNQETDFLIRERDIYIYILHEEWIYIIHSIEKKFNITEEIPGHPVTVQQRIIKNLSVKLLSN